MKNLHNNYVHSLTTKRYLFPDAEVADNTVKIIREAVKTIYLHANKDVPKWIVDNDDYGWEKDGFRSFAEVTLVNAVKRDDPDNVKIVFVHDGKEHVREILSPGSDPESAVKELLSKTRIPYKCN